MATDIAARGVHVDDVELVVHCDPPAEHKAYLHRSGRTARAGQSGDVVTVVLPEQRKDTQAVLRKAGITVAAQQVAADSGPVLQLVGTVAPRIAPPAPVSPKTAVAQAPAQQRQQQRRPRPDKRRRASRSAGSSAR